ncbi:MULTISPECIES: hypothetical protein [Natrialba]|uniref:hypothetical protein n=1 Tax=Natrialba TaxID=63742 RepID=UPI000AC8B263|nr:MULTISPECIES: hypothetical protein [Natrialba]
MSYLLGFPTPIVEVFLTLIVLFLIVSVYLGMRMEGTTAVRDADEFTQSDVREVSD